MKTLKSEQNVILTESLKKLWQTAVQLEQSTNIPQELDAIEGRRFLLRILSASLDSFVEYIDANRPAFRHSESAHRKMFGDCPDADYLQAPIDLRNGRSYRVKGQIPKATLYVGVMLYGRGGQMSTRLIDEELNVDDEGNFELLISADPDQNPDLLGKGDDSEAIKNEIESEIHGASRNKEIRGNGCFPEDGVSKRDEDEDTKLTYSSSFMQSG